MHINCNTLQVDHVFFTMTHIVLPVGFYIPRIEKKELSNVVLTFLFMKRKKMSIPSNNFQRKYFPRNSYVVIHSNIRRNNNTFDETVKGNVKIVSEYEWKMNYQHENERKKRFVSTCLQFRIFYGST